MNTARESKRRGLMAHLKGGGRLYLMSDGGLPAFCDPGQRLISRCHGEGIVVTATAFHHSVALALALSGFPMRRYIFEGFPPRETRERRVFYERLARQREVTVFMDTPYRLEKVLLEVGEVMPKRMVFLARNLGHQEQLCLRALGAELPGRYGKGGKGPFVLCLGEN